MLAGLRGEPTTAWLADDLEAFFVDVWASVGGGVGVFGAALVG